MPATALAPRGVLTAPTTIDAASARSTVRRIVDGVSHSHARSAAGTRVTLAPTYASVTRSSHQVQSSATARSAGGEGVLGGGLEPRVEVIEGQVERGAVAQALHGDDREALGGDHRDERQAAEELHEPKNREKRCNHPRSSRGGSVGGPCLLSRLVLAFARC